MAAGKAPQGKIASVGLLGHEGNLEFTQDAEGLKVKLPAQQPCKHAFCFKVSGLKMNAASPPVPVRAR